MNNLTFHLKRTLQYICRNSWVSSSECSFGVGRAKTQLLTVNDGVRVCVYKKLELRLKRLTEC